MTQKEIIEGNELTASFLGFQRSGPWWSLPVMFPHNLLTDRYTKAMACNSSQLSFHESWDWLMPVVEKIETLFKESLLFYIKDKRAYIEKDTQASMAYGDELPNVPECYSGFCDTKIEAVYETVIHFIKWYNSLSK